MAVRHINRGLYHLELHNQPFTHLTWQADTASNSFMVYVAPMSRFLKLMSKSQPAINNFPYRKAIRQKLICTHSPSIPWPMPMIGCEYSDRLRKKRGKPVIYSGDNVVRWANYFQVSHIPVMCHYSDLLEIRKQLYMEPPRFPFFSHAKKSKNNKDRSHEKVSLCSGLVVGGVAQFASRY